MDKRMVEIIQNSVGGCEKHWAELIAKALHNIGYRLQGETAKEFAEKLKEKFNAYEYIVVDIDSMHEIIDEGCKEFTEGNMNQEELQKVLNDNRHKITINEILQAIFELKKEASKMKTAEGVSEKDYYFYDGQITAYLNCLDLLEKFSKDYAQQGNKKGRR